MGLIWIKAPGPTFGHVAGMQPSDPREVALGLVRSHNSLDIAVEIARDRTLEAAASRDDATADFWTDVFWVLLDIESAG